MNFAALKETVGSGIKVEGDIYDYGVKEQYLASLLQVMGDEKKWKEESVKAREFVKDYEWSKIAERWENEF
jgi:UTP-glucose-1-phosphate uridylyltransferase